MRHSKTTKVMALMLSLVMITSVFVGNTLSRYVTSVSSTDSARVAIWGINGKEVTMELFNTTYDLDGKKIAESNNKTDKIIAPGTGGQSAFSIINYEDSTIPPEVAYQVTIDLDDSQVDPKIVNNTSIQWKLDEGSWGTFDQLKTSLLNLSGDSSGTGINTFAPGEFAEMFKGDVEHKIYWQWALDGNNEVDTQMGNDALISTIGVTISVKITAQQTDDLITVGILNGANQVVNVDDIQPAVFRSVAPKADLQEVKVNNETVDPSNYDVTEGSTIITFHKDYLETLEEGKYIIEIISKNMTAKTQFIVAEAPIVHKDVIPEGGMYYVNVPVDELQDGIYEYYNIGVYDNYISKYEAGDEFPEPQFGDVYVYGDYEYRYGISGYGDRWQKNDGQNGWGVMTINRNKSEYNEILSSIGNKNVINLDFTFFGCSSLIKSPKIPDVIESMSNTFMICTSLVEGPSKISDNVKNMHMAFNGCSKLKKAPVLSKNIVSMHGLFSGCESLEEAPIIPDGVTDMSNAFWGAGIKEAPIIPNSVTNMDYTFYSCINLTGTIEINANPTSYNNVLNGTGITWIDGSISDELKKKIVDNSEITLNKVIDGGDTSKTGVYYVGVTSNEVGNYFGISDKYINGAFPDEPQTGDVYVEGDYEYRYNMNFNASDWSINTKDGWGVRVIDDSKSEYGTILSSIAGKDVKYMNFAFIGCSNLVSAPVIPNTIVDMGNAFVVCASLVNPPIIPENVENIGWMFVASPNVSGTFEVNSNPSYYDGVLSGTQITEVTGLTTLKAEILATK